MPRPKRLRATEVRRESKETFGTSTRETPRFTGRPTLKELFADVANEGMKTPRAYQTRSGWKGGQRQLTVPA